MTKVRPLSNVIKPLYYQTSLLSNQKQQTVVLRYFSTSLYTILIESTKILSFHQNMCQSMNYQNSVLLKKFGQKK